MTKNFNDLEIRKEVIDAINDVGWLQPTPIQVEAIPYGLEGVDMFAQAKTGTGKTGAYISISLSRVNSGEYLPSVLVLVAFAFSLELSYKTSRS